MITLMSQMLGCLLIAAGIGVAVGWLLRGLPKNSVDHSYGDLANLLRVKEQALETTSHDLKVKTSAMQILEQKIMSSETLYSSAQREVTARGERIKALEAELAVRSKRLTDLEAEGVAARRRESEFTASVAAQTLELRGAQQARQAAEQAREVMEQEVRVQREHIAQLNEGLADRDELRARLKTLESAQGRVHQLEVELSDREAAHRGVIQQLEQAIIERDRRMSEFDANLAAQVEELRGAQQARQAAEQAREVMEQEVRVQREHIAQLNEGLADREQLRARLEKFEAVQSRVHQLEVELSDREAAHRGVIQQLEQAIIERDRRMSEFDANLAAQVEELRGAQQARQAAEQAREVMEQEVRVQREHIAQLNEGLADREQLRVRLEKFESVQERVHQLEVELSDREAAHRGAIQQLEQSIVERDRRIEELVPITHLLREKQSELKEWERAHARTVQELEGEKAKLQEQCAAHEQLRAQQLLNEQRLHERDEQIASLHRELHALQAERHALVKEVRSIPEKDEEIDRLQKRLRDLRVALRTKPAPTPEGARQTRPNGAESSTQGGPPKGSKEPQKDDLKKIRGIGPVFADTLNKLGTHTFIQIARWKPEDIKNVAKKLETDPERIKRDKWIAEAKEQHYRKYGERL